MTGSATAAGHAKPGPLLPPVRQSPLDWLGLVAALLALTLVGMAALASPRAGGGSANAASGAVLIAVAGQALEPPDAAAARAVERLAALPGVAAATAVAPSAGILQIGLAPGQDSGVRWVRVEPRGSPTVSLADLQQTLRADAVKVASPSGGAEPAAAGGIWLASWMIAAVGLSLLIVAIAWGLAERAFVYAAPTIERLRGLGAREPLLASLLLRRAPLGCALAGLTSFAALIGGWVALDRFGALTPLGKPDALALAFALTPPQLLPAVLATGLTLSALRRSARSWP